MSTAFQDRRIQVGDEPLVALYGMLSMRGARQIGIHRTICSTLLYIDMSQLTQRVASKAKQNVMTDLITRSVTRIANGLP